MPKYCYREETLTFFSPEFNRIFD